MAADALTLDELRAALGGEPARAAFAAAEAEAGWIAADTAALLARLCDGAWATPQEEARAFHGLLIAAAAGRRELAPAFLDFLGAGDEARAGVLGENQAGLACALTLSLLPRQDAGAVGRVVALCEDPSAAPDIRRGLWRALARLLAEGAIPRPRALAALERGPGPDPSASPEAALGWAEAVALLGLERHRALLAGALRDPAAEAFVDRDLAEGLLAVFDLSTAAEEDDLERFAQAGIAPIADAAEAAAALAPAGPQVAGLSPRAFAWLDGFLLSGEAGEAAMSLEAADGLFAALSLTAGDLAPEQAAALALGSAAAEGEPAPLAAARGLLAGRWAARRPDEPPLLLETSADALGADWAWGFLEGVAAAEDAWADAWRDVAAEPALAALQALEGEEPTPAERRGLAARLEAYHAALVRFHRDPQSRQARAPVRVDKIGRNEPCPCGSGKKHKHCCLGKDP